MSSQKRTIMFFALSFISVMAVTTLLDKLGLNPKPVPKPAAVEAAADPAAAKPDAAKVAAKDAATPAAATTPKAEVSPSKVNDPPKAAPNELVIGAANANDPKEYHLELHIDQKGAGVREMLSARYDGETIDGIPDRQKHLHLITDDPLTFAPRSFAITVIPNGIVQSEGPLPTGEADLDSRLWEVVRDTPNGPTVKKITKTKEGAGESEGQQIAFRHTMTSPAVTVTKTYRIWKGEDGFEFDIKFEAPADAVVGYRLFGPHGIPIEGEAFTSNFRDVFFGQLKAGGSTELLTRPASEVIKAEGQPERLQAMPIKYAGVENQYFAMFFSPDPAPTATSRWDREALAYVARKDAAAPQKSDVGVQLVSLPIKLSANTPITHTYRVFSGPKDAKVLVGYDATELASYRKGGLPIPLASTLAQSVIAPLLDYIYGFTQWVARLVGLQNGNYGIAIILLTMTVRLMMFPVGRKQAMISKKMQDLQPFLAEIKEKYKDDKERQTKETFALYKEHGFNPAAGCAPALLQMPIFVGLWQALNNSVALRHSQFLYIKNLAAPDMLFQLPFELPFGLGKYFNLLPFLVVALMLIQTKLFSPPAITDEAKMNQKVMKYMMVFMAFMFYKVPSGLGIYFITSSLWQICERLLLPKITKSKPTTALAKASPSGEMEAEPTRRYTPQPSPVAKADNAKPKGWFARKMQELIEQAENERTIRNNGNGFNGRATNGSSRDQTPPDRDRKRRPKR